MASPSISLPVPPARPKTASLASIVSPFARLRRLLGDAPPGRTPAIDMTIGEPRHDMPDFLMPKLQEAFAGFAKYPPIKGTEDVRRAIAEWIERRYKMPGKIDPERHVIPIVGSREGLFSAVFPAIERKRGTLPAGAQAAILIPNPFYQVYAGGAIAAGAEPVFLAASRATHFLPDLDVLAADKALLARTAAMVLCSPANPQGTIASKDYLIRALELARANDFLLFSDECYSEIYTEAPPPGGVEAAVALGRGFDNLVVFNSLSKRSNLPGLRIGFAAGDAAFIEAFAEFRNVTAPQLPLPIQHAGAAIWREETHVEASRQRYVEKFGIADAVIGNRYGYRRPGGGFFLWLDVSQFGGSEAATVTLWKRSGVKVLPGAFLARDMDDGTNPGKDYIRIALVHDAVTTREALERLVEVLR
jgi:N-succinyldiaminopimelate aminotransferase